MICSVVGLSIVGLSVVDVAMILQFCVVDLSNYYDVLIYSKILYIEPVLLVYPLIAFLQLLTIV